MTKKPAEEIGKKRGSILGSLTKMFAAFIAVSVVISLVISNYASFREIREESHEHSQKAAQSLESIISDRKQLGIDNESMLPIRYTLMYLCRGYNMKYLYLFTIDEEKSEYHYLITVSQDADETERMMEMRGHDAVVPTDVFPQPVLDANDGDNGTHIVTYDNEFGQVIGWVYPMDVEYDGRRVLIGAEYLREDLYASIRSHTLMLIIPISVILITESIILLFITHRRIIVPVAKISSFMRSFSDDYGKDEQKLEVTQDNEIGEIAASFNKMSDDIHRLIADNTTLSEIKLQSEIQLEVARRIQCGIVPENIKYDGESFSLCGFARAARSVGGDFYDSFLLDDSRVCIVIGDVSGKGITAALFMTMTKTALREIMKSGISPAEALNRANDEICASNPEGLFATLFAAVLDMKTGVLTFANAGHNPPVILGGEPELVKCETGIALGVFEDAGIVNETLTIESGGGLLLYTDGVTEAVNSDNVFFGNDRLLDACKGCLTAESAVEAVKTSVLDFYDGRAQFDDLTMISLFFTSKPGALTKLELLPEITQTQRVLGAVKECVGDSPRLKKICLACDEAFANICAYSGAKTVTLEYGGSEQFTAVFTDDGEPFDPLAPRAEKDFEDLDEGGMGISLIKQIAQKAEYSRENGRNILKLTFAV